MKVTFLKNHTMDSSVLKKGQSCIVITSIAEKLIEKGICEENKSVTLRDKIVEQSAENAAQAIIDNLPDHAADIVKIISTIKNKIVLEELATDDRVTVADAATAQLEELK